MPVLWSQNPRQLVIAVNASHQELYPFEPPRLVSPVRRRISGHVGGGHIPDGLTSRMSPGMYQYRRRIVYGIVIRDIMMRSPGFGSRALVGIPDMEISRRLKRLSALVACS
jgi:hypothetical protein